MFVPHILVYIMYRLKAYNIICINTFCRNISRMLRLPFPHQVVRSYTHAHFHNDVGHSRRRGLALAGTQSFAQFHALFVSFSNLDTCATPGE